MKFLTAFVLLLSVSSFGAIDRNVLFKCPQPKIVNKTKTWTEQDKFALQTAKNTCKSHYSGCLKTFTKKREMEYAALCDQSTL